MVTEKRQYQVVDGASRPSGRTTVTIHCPFCGEDVIAYKWSLCGSGKKCGCGALFDSFGIAEKKIKE